MSSFGPVDGDWSKWTKPGALVEVTYAELVKNGVILPSPNDPSWVGGTCYWCYWGWPKPIADIYDRAKADIEALDEDGEHALKYGPAHVVWEDENWNCAESCIEGCDNPPPYMDLRPDVLAIVKRSLVELAALPESVKTEPEGYDGDHPENFPPTMEMVKR